MLSLFVDKLNKLILGFYLKNNKFGTINLLFFTEKQRNKVSLAILIFLSYKNLLEKYLHLIKLMLAC
jgi:hypothetical protein